MGALDCNTERGQIYIERQEEIVRRCAVRAACNYVMTPSERAGLIDAIFFRGVFIETIAEVRARDMTIAQLKGYGDYLVTFDKLVKGRDLAKALAVPLHLIVGLYSEEAVLAHIVTFPICDSEGNWTAEFRTRSTTTQETCNGGTIERMNTYVTLRGAAITRMTQ